ncbi:MAG: acyl carrier protein [Bacteroidales bacterium]
MEIKKFVKEFADQFDETDISEFSNNTIFKKLDEWSSLMALSIICMIDEEYDVIVNGDAIINSDTIQDLFNLVKTKI